MKKLLIFMFILCMLIGCAPIKGVDTEEVVPSSELPQFMGIEHLDDGTLAIYTPPSAEIFFVIDTNTIWLEVDLSEQTLLVHKGEETTGMFSISSGRPLIPTPTGSYRIYKMRAENIIWTPEGIPQDAPWMMLFHNEYAIHSADWHDDFGTPVSLGCINMRPEEAREVYYQVEIGTHVYIHE